MLASRMWVSTMAYLMVRSPSLSRDRIATIAQPSCVLDSAKVPEDNEITPQSDYVILDYTGHCVWFPRFDRSESDCCVDVTWFPFDEQTCELDFVSWTMPKTMLNLHIINHSYALSSFKKPEGWSLLGKL